MKNYTDHYGTEIKAGVRVAYNFQGEVRIGHVTDVTQTKKYGRVGVCIHIEQLDGFKSKVSSWKNLVVIS